MTSSSPIIIIYEQNENKENTVFPRKNNRSELGQLCLFFPKLSAATLSGICCAGQAAVTCQQSTIVKTLLTKIWSQNWPRVSSLYSLDPSSPAPKKVWKKYLKLKSFLENLNFDRRWLLSIQESAYDKAVAYVQANDVHKLSWTAHNSVNKMVGSRHSSVDSSAPTFLQPRVRIPNSPTMLFLNIV